MTITDRIKNALAALGSTPEEVAEKLGAEGCVGYRCKPRACPIFHYLSRNGFHVTWVDHHQITFVAGAKKSIVASNAISEFQIRFDYGAFDRLALQEDGE